MAGYVEIFCGIAALFLALYYYLTSTFDTWKVRGVPGPRPMPLFGNFIDVTMLRKAVGVFLIETCSKYKNEPFIGIFARRTPMLIVRDTQHIRDILVKDFTCFSDRGFALNERAEPLSPNVFFLEAERWRPVRTFITPIFTPRKLRDMFPLIMECANKLEQSLEKLAAEGGSVDIRELTSKYTIDVIGSVGFGLNINSLSGENKEFHRIGKQVFAPGVKQAIRFRLREDFPRLYNLLSFVLPRTEYTTYLTKLIIDTLKYREKHYVDRPDFINMLLELKKNPEKLEGIKLTDKFFAAQAFIFFAAGFETSSSAISHALYELALNPEVQDKLRKEIREHFAKTNGELTYEQVNTLTYLNLVFLETLRKYPAAQLLTRKSTTPYTFEGTKVTIPANLHVWVPVYAFHYDPTIYPNPNAFIPERFTPDKIAQRDPMHYLPFGQGPRNCLGERFANYESKLGLIKILCNYKVDVCEKTVIPYVIDPASFTLMPKGGTYLKLSKADN